MTIGAKEAVEQCSNNQSSITRPVLRPYQLEAVEAVERVLSEKRHRRLLLTLPTGTGKTVAFAEVIRRRRAAGDLRPVLILAHRVELIDQAAAKVRWANPDLEVAVECGSRTAPESADVVVASVQTLQSPHCKRLSSLKPGLVIVDEAHHSTATSYRRILGRFGALDGGIVPLLGCTSTPYRFDRADLGDIFDAEVYRMGLQEAIEQGWLCPIRCYRVVTETSLAGVHTRAGDFATGELGRAVNVAARTDLVIEKWREVAGDRRTLVFCVDVRHAWDVAEAFRAGGFTAEAVDGAMKAASRAAVISRFRSGETQVLTNCDLLGEGFDLPEVSAVVMM